MSSRKVGSTRNSKPKIIEQPTVQKMVRRRTAARRKPVSEVRQTPALTTRRTLHGGTVK